MLGPIASCVTASPGTTYYFKAYATNWAGTGCGSVISFTTVGEPTVTTNAASQITTTQATINGSITSDGGGGVTDCGFYWGASSNPTTHISFGCGGTNPIHSFYSYIPVTPGATYYFQFYATNSAGTGYGSVMSFTTPAIQPTVVVPTVTTSAATGVTSSAATLNGGISSSGNGSITDYGFYWGTSSSPSTQVSVGSGTTSSFSGSVSVAPGTTYYFEAYATNQAGTGYGSVMSFTTPAIQPTVVVPTVTTSAATGVTSSAATLNGGISASGGGSITDYGFYWGTSPSPSTQVSVGSGTTGSFSGSVSVTPGTTYYFEAYATNSAGTGYGSNMSFTVPAIQPTVVVPTVTTSAATQVTCTTATLNGGISASGDGSITDYGFYWGTSSSPSTQVSVGSGTTGSFSWSVSVTPGTTYYFEAYATNRREPGTGA